VSSASSREITGPLLRAPCPSPFKVSSTACLPCEYILTFPRPFRPIGIPNALNNHIFSNKQILINKHSRRPSRSLVLVNAVGWLDWSPALTRRQCDANNCYDKRCRHTRAELFFLPLCCDGLGWVDFILRPWGFFFEKYLYLQPASSRL
jgi:hypothetical protein